MTNNIQKHKRPKILSCGRYQLTLEHPLIMGIVNLTDDSFSGDGFANNNNLAIKHAFHLIESGADILDLGAESSRPGSKPVALEEEWNKLFPLISALRDCGKPISIDTNKAEIMRRAINEGVDLINDIYALQQPGALEVIAKSNCAICLMHMLGNPENMQQSPTYHEVITEVNDFLNARLTICLKMGISIDRLIVDPGFGFGKTYANNLKLATNLKEIVPKLPILVGVSRKSMIGELSGDLLENRDFASNITALYLATLGAQILRVHDVAGCKKTLQIWKTLNSQENK